MPCVHARCSPVLNSSEFQEQSKVWRIHFYFFSIRSIHRLLPSRYYDLVIRIWVKLWRYLGTGLEWKPSLPRTTVASFRVISVWGRAFSCVARDPHPTPHLFVCFCCNVIALYWNTECATRESLKVDQMGQ